MLLLAFDTATPAVTVAVHDGSVVLASRSAVDPRRHAELLAPAIDEVLGGTGATRHDLTDIAVGVGPGPFTGLRVGLVTARSLGYALGVPVHGAYTLDVLAWEYARGRSHAERSPSGSFLVATDARRREVYWARYTNTGGRTDGPAVARPADVPDRDLPTVGDGGERYPEAFPDPRPPVHPSADALAELTVERLRSGPATAGLASRAEVLAPQPCYLRRPDATVPGPRKQVTPA